MDKDTKMDKEVTTESRRKFLKTAGKFAVYTPPALMLMSNASATYVKDSNGVVIKKYKYRKYSKYRRYFSKRGYRRRYTFRGYNRGYKRSRW